MFSKILIANRGEIARRIIQTARRLNIETVAIYAPVDAGSLHVKDATYAHALRGNAPLESYLDQETILAIAKKSGAQAIHPGYGFLSENADFAQACKDAGIVFIGPQPETIRLMGNKSEAKKIAAACQVPLIQGVQSDDQSPMVLQDKAQTLGYPLLIKAMMGGGGRGIRRVDKAVDFLSALESCAREAASAFGDGSVMLEKVIEQPRHIEVQIFGDTHGNIIHLYDRDCTLQRRNQKVIEEAPATFIPDFLRDQLFEAALKLSKAARYEGAGTIEFLVDKAGDYYFLEMNTRLQVEHRVTEYITGLDCVELQLKVAAGMSLGIEQSDVRCQGHAVQARLYAEDPARHFMTSTGTVTQAYFPPIQGNLIIDTAIETGQKISPYYDAMVAKIVGCGRARHDALRACKGALEETLITGITTNKHFLHTLLTHHACESGDVWTTWIDDHMTEVTKETEVPPMMWVGACAAIVHTQTLQEKLDDPWSAARGWTLSGYRPLHLTLDAKGNVQTVTCTAHKNNAWHVEGPDVAGEIEIVWDGKAPHFTFFYQGEKYEMGVCMDAAPQPGFLHNLTLTYKAQTLRFDHSDPLYHRGALEDELFSLKAPMTGKVVHIHTKTGGHVSRGDVLMTMEAMKMEQHIKAPYDGIVEQIPFAVGDIVEEGLSLIQLAPHAPLVEAG